MNRTNWLAGAWLASAAMIGCADTGQDPISEVARAETFDPIAFCNASGLNVIIGTPNNDVINGTAGADCIVGLGGQDTINGLGGDDTIFGGDGNDVIDGGDGNDQ